MRLRTLKIAISLVCATFAAVHVFVPAIKVDAITLGLIAIGLLPWFQPLVKSLEFGGVKIELQDVKDAADKIASALDAQTPLVSAEALSEETGVLSFIGKVAEQDPNLALVGLRIEVEKLLIEIAEAAGVPTARRGAGALLSELSRRDLIPQAVATGLNDFISLGNRAAHGATVSNDAAALALRLAPQLLGVLSALRSKVIERQRLEGKLSKAQVLAAIEKRSPIRVPFEKPFAEPPNISIGFYGPQDEELNSGSLHVTQMDKQGFCVEVLSLPSALDSVFPWSVKWKASGPGT